MFIFSVVEDKLQSEFLRSLLLHKKLHSNA